MQYNAKACYHDNLETIYSAIINWKKTFNGQYATMKTFSAVN